MSASFLTTLSIISVEIIVVLLILLTVLFLRFRKMKSTLSNNPVSDGSDNDDKVIPFQTYLQDEINRTTEKLEQDDGDKTALSHRLEYLTKEKLIIDASADSNDYWSVIDKTYASGEGEEKEKEETEKENGSTDKSDQKSFDPARIQRLESFKDTFTKMQANLKESFDTIDTLKHKISELPSSEENNQLEEMIDKLSIDNIGLNKQVNSANKELISILDEIPT